MNALSALREGGHQFAAAVGDDDSLAGEYLLEGSQLGRVAPLVAQVAQRGVALAQRLGVALQRRAIVPVHLAQRIVQVAAAAGGWTGDQPHVLRHKEHDVQPPSQVGAALAHPIYANRLLQPCRAVRQRSLLQDNLDLLDTVTAHDLGPHAGVGQP